ncbi:MAG: cytochrome c biogenesis protein CcsA [Planctomycetaceae bacterium]|nr:cytochrome c biogenesis protein CcsA [Planctomycetaceae bacterium]MCB9949908.1 cytochrome c biogenesis protein CcsA [Planctomycetaceae bacterium]
MHWDKVSVLCFFASFTIALLLELSQFLYRTRVTRLGAIGFTAAGVIAQTIYLTVRSQQHDLPPLLGSSHDWLLVLAWLTAVALIGVQVWNLEFSLGVFLLPVVLVLVGAARFVSEAPNPRIGTLRHWGMFHASLWVLGIGGVTLALIASLMYLVQHRRLRSKQTESPGLHLFSLEQLSRINWWLIIFSVPLLTLGMASGLWMTYLARDSEHPVNLASLEFVANALMWLMMAVLCGWMISSHKAAGKLVAWRTVFACGFLLIVMLVIRLLNSGSIHGA